MTLPPSNNGPLDEITRLNSVSGDGPRMRRAVNTGVERGSTILFKRAEDLYDNSIKPGYGTDGLATQYELKRLLAELEGARDVYLLPSGLAALTVPIFASLKSGDEVLAVEACYARQMR
jgi:cysteine-S-conjugate beta-lyase